MLLLLSLKLSDLVCHFKIVILKIRQLFVLFLELTFLSLVFILQHIYFWLQLFLDLSKIFIFNFHLVLNDLNRCFKSIVFNTYFWSLSVFAHTLVGVKKRCSFDGSPDWLISKSLIVGLFCQFRGILLRENSWHPLDSFICFFLLFSCLVLNNALTLNFRSWRFGSWSWPALGTALNCRFRALIVSLICETFSGWFLCLFHGTV